MDKLRLAAPPGSKDDEERAWLCFRRMGALKYHGQKVMSVLKYELKDNHRYLFDIKWMNDDKFIQELTGFVQISGISPDPTGIDMLTKINSYLKPGSAKHKVEWAPSSKGDPKISPKAVNEMEVEAYAEQISEYFDDLADDQTTFILRKYAKYFDKAFNPWRINSMDLFIWKTQSSTTVLKRHLKLLDSLPSVEKKKLNDLGKRVNDA